MRMQFEPAHERIALAKFHVMCFGQTAQAGSEPITIAVADFGKNTNARNACGISDTFHNAGKQRIDVLKLPEHPRKTK
jgi:hypothetical protein